MGVLSISRRKARELAFILLFEKSFTNESIDEIIERAKEARQIEVNEFTMMLVKGAQDQMSTVDEIIYENSEKWKEGRISRVAMAIMRIAVFEMLFVHDMDESISINEAVELAKKFGDDNDPAFINGVLGGISRSRKKQKDKNISTQGKD